MTASVKLASLVFFLSFRFWWEADDVFTQQQRDELLKYSLSRLICDNSDIYRVPLDSFLFGKLSDYVSCDHVPSMHLGAWREEKSEGGLEDVSGLFLYNYLKNNSLLFYIY